ncbi:MAG: peptidoglycan DD-metalloendopeptidase family protein [Actinobacteria bacterium]|nr:peptidoglycan DD-metalloendopeptidase family protein [Actinomycetota bacterium]
MTVLIFLNSYSAYARPRSRSNTVKKQETAATSAQIANLNTELKKTTNEYNYASNSLKKINANIRTNKVKIKEAEEELQRTQQVLSKRVAAVYRYGKVNFFDVLFGANDFRDFVVRWDLMTKIARQDAEVYKKVKQKKAEIELSNQKLLEEKKRKEVFARRLRNSQSQLASRLRKQQELLNRAKSQGASRIGRLAVSRDVGPLDVSFRNEGFVFPVEGAHSFSDDWGDSRGGGRRRHKGNDIFALKGTPVVAVVDGVVSMEKRGGSGGIMLWLDGDDGNVYFYAHLNGYAVGTGARVRSGQTIAYVGDTGNARGSSPHLHFEIHVDGRRAVNPHETLEAAD